MGVKMVRTISVSAILAAALVITALPANAVTGNNSTYGAFDESSGTRTFVLPSAGAVGDVNITIDFSKCDDPTVGPSGTSCVGTGFSFNREIIFRLTDPDGTTVNLVNADTYSGQTPGAHIQLTLDDEAANPVGGSSLQSGTFRPVGSLSDMDGDNIGGTWTLYIEDDTGADPLEFFSATLEVTPANLVQVPEPAALILFGSSLVALAATRRRRRG
jgi:PEP-CTERM motif